MSNFMKFKVLVSQNKPDGSIVTKANDYYFRPELIGAFSIDGREVFVQGAGWFPFADDFKFDASELLGEMSPAQKMCDTISKIECKNE